MAGKMQNYLDWYQRHHTAAEYAALVAGDVKIQKFLDRQSKIPAAIRALDDLSKDIGKKVMLPAIQRASDFLAQVEKSGAGAVRDTGILAQSIGSTKAKYYPATFCGFVASGPRRGFARAVQVTVKPGKNGLTNPKLKRKSKKFTQTTPTTLQIKNPVIYARYLIKGRKAIVARGQRGAIMLLSPLSASGTFFRHGVKAAAPRDFMQSAESAKDSAANMATCEMQLNLQKLLPE